ncbi:MAG: alpha-L-fucosidase [Caldilineaceae bacterium]
MSYNEPVAPQPLLPVPSPRQLAWHQMEVYGFVHFTVNTFSDKEWGYGDESPALFAPTDFDANQIVGAAEAGGMAGLILTCKHHDGFCLWPSQFTEHSVKNSPWRNGQGDVVRELAGACRSHGLKFGVYLSPWDRNHPDYGSAAYLDYYRAQLIELCSNYGPLFEVWFDGANGGDGFYGGHREMRKIDNHTYYDWPNTWKIVRALQPNACIFSDAGPDVRWVGNEKGIAGDPCWHTMDGNQFSPGNADNHVLNQGDRSGSDWIPAECDVSIRPGWFYHPAEDDKVRSPENLLDLYFQSVGRGASLLLNLPPDRRGQIPAQDVAALSAFRKRLNAIFEANLASDAQVSATHWRGQDEQFAPDHLLDGDTTTYWTTDDAITSAQVELRFPQPITFNIIRLREFIALGQRVDEFLIEVDQAGQWQEYDRGQAIGNRRLVRGATCTTDKIRLTIAAAGACPAISELSIFFDSGQTSNKSA